MKRLVSLICFCSLCSSLVALSPPLLTTSHHFMPIRALLVAMPTQEPVWIEGKVVSQEDTDVYIIEDGTSKIRIFLCIDELLGYTLIPGNHIAAWGKVDKSSIGWEKNELYVEKLYLMPEKEQG